ncbi:MAG: hypothetical protein COV72_09300, partial [Candidatus Omnitrophica bacterium CG11_big_fil_rev_8_21_14_0_20_42_13]
SLAVAGTVGIGTNAPVRKLHVNSILADDIARFEGHSDSPGFLDITNVDAGGIRLSTDATGPFRIRTENIIGGDQFIVDTNANVAIGPNLPTSAPSPGNNQAKENLDVNDVWLRAANGGTGAWASSTVLTLDYSDCTIIEVGFPSGPHATYCPEGYITVGGETDGNDYIPENQICCRLRGITTVNWNARRWQ